MPDVKTYTKEEIAQAITNVAVDSVSGMSTATNEMRQIIVDLDLYVEVEAKCDELMGEYFCTVNSCICGKCE